MQEAENFVQSAQEAAAAGNHVKAVEDYSAAIQFAASNGELRMARARSHKELGQTGEAVNDLL